MHAHELKRRQTESQALDEQHVEALVDDVAQERKPNERLQLLVLQVDGVYDCDPENTAENYNVEGWVHQNSEIVKIVQVVFKARSQKYVYTVKGN